MNSFSKFHLILYGFFKSLAVYLLIASGSNAFAHTGHGGDSLVQHALEHGYMLIPAAVLLIFVLSRLVKKKTD